MRRRLIETAETRIQQALQTWCEHVYRCMSCSRVILDLLVLLALLAKMDQRVWGEMVDPRADRVMLVSVVLLELLERREMLERMVPLWVCHILLMFLLITLHTPLGFSVTHHVAYGPCEARIIAPIPCSTHTFSLSASLQTSYLLLISPKHVKVSSGGCYQGRGKWLHLFVFNISVDFQWALSAQNSICQGEPASTLPINTQSCQCPSLSAKTDRDIWQHRAAPAQWQANDRALGFYLAHTRTHLTLHTYKNESCQDDDTSLMSAFSNMKIATALPSLGPEPCINTSKCQPAEWCDAVVTWSQVCLESRLWWMK